MYKQQHSRRFLRNVPSTSWSLMDPTFVVLFPQLYFHGEPIKITMKVNNESNKTVKKFKVTGEIIRDNLAVLKWSSGHDLSTDLLVCPSSHSGPDHRYRPVQRRQIHQDGLHQRVCVRRRDRLSNPSLIVDPWNQSDAVLVFPHIYRETVEPSSTYENTLSITPLLSENKEKRGLALDGRLKDEDTNLASTTM